MNGLRHLYNTSARWESCVATQVATKARLSGKSHLGFLKDNLVRFCSTCYLLGETQFWAYGFLWFSYGFPMVFLWFSYGFMLMAPGVHILTQMGWFSAAPFPLVSLSRVLRSAAGLKSSHESLVVWTPLNNMSSSVGIMKFPRSGKL